MEYLGFSLQEFKIFALILMRISVVLFLMPIFDSSMYPKQVKLGLALILAMALFPVIRIDAVLFPTTASGLVLLFVSELMVGMILGLCVRLFFGAVQLAGQMIGFQMGFSMINVVDPQSGVQVSIIDQIGSMVVMLVFLLLNGHHILLGALVESFQLVGIGAVVLKKALLSQVLALSTEMFVLAVKIGAPAIAALLFTSAAFGLSARFVPQMNILIAAFPVKIAVGLIFFGICLQVAATITQTYVTELSALLTNLLEFMSGT